MTERRVWLIEVTVDDGEPNKMPDLIVRCCAESPKAARAEAARLAKTKLNKAAQRVGYSVVCVGALEETL